MKRHSRTGGREPPTPEYSVTNTILLGEKLGSFERITIETPGVASTENMVPWRDPDFEVGGTSTKRKGRKYYVLRLLSLSTLTHDKPNTWVNRGINTCENKRDRGSSYPVLF